MRWRTLAAPAAWRAFGKLSLVASSELLWLDKFRYVWDTLSRRRAPVYRGFRDYRLRGGVSIRLREGSTDWKVFDEVFMESVYAPCIHAFVRQPQPRLLIDLGANVGLSAIYLARRLRPARVVAVEPDAGNFSMLLENLRRAGLLDKSTALRAFAGAEPGFAEIEDSGNGAWGMRMGPRSGARSGAGIPVMTLAGIAEEAAPAPRAPQAARDGAPQGAPIQAPQGVPIQAPQGVPIQAPQGVPIVVKCDIEGAERQLFETIRTWDQWIGFMILEIHTELFPAAELRACLESSAYHWTVHGEIPAHARIAVVALERLGEKAARCFGAGSG